MTEKSYFWYDDAAGDALAYAPYTNDEISDVMRQAFQFDRTYTLPSINYPFPTAPREPFTVRLSPQTGSVVVEEGVALIDGKVYFHRSPKALDCSTSGAGYYRIVLRKTFPAIVDDLPTGNTVKAEVLYSANWDSGNPEPTRTDDEVWEVTIAVIYNDGTSLYFYPDTSKGFWDRSYYASGVSTEYGNRVMPEACINIPARRGGSATNWGTAGDTKYVCPLARIEVGSVTIDASPKAHTFAEAFAYTPIVVLTPWDADGSTWSGNNFCISALSTTGFSIRFDDRTGLSYVHYVAIGPIF